MLLLFLPLLIHHTNASPEFCTTRYVQPGASFTLECAGNHAGAINIYSVQQTKPSHDQIILSNSRFGNPANSVRVRAERDNANEEDEGEYTCIMLHGRDADPQYSVATCNIIIIDLCDQQNCVKPEICKADYDAGTAECVCKECTGRQMPSLICSDTCKTFYNKCYMRFEACQQKKMIKVAHKGFCPDFVKPKIRDKVDIVSLEGDKDDVINLPSGLKRDGTPSVKIAWVFTSGDIVRKIRTSRDIHTFVLDESTVGEYTATIMQCKDESSAVVNKFNVSVNAPPILGTVPVCSVFPAGVIESFFGNAMFYDLECSHIIAADVIVGRSLSAYLHAWFIYGTFDEHDGQGAMQAITFYLGRSIIQFQRGWLVNEGGNKWTIEENVPMQFHETGCTIIFENLHLKMDCPEFVAYYDGTISGHIVLKHNISTVPITSTSQQIGLCFDVQSASRENWQVAQSRGNCGITSGLASCASSTEHCQVYPTPPRFQGGVDNWGRCGDGAELSCDEVNCGVRVPTNTQTCSLNQANRVSCELKYEGRLGSDVLDDGCPGDECEWKKEIVSRGCPQPNPPFMCDD